MSVCRSSVLDPLPTALLRRIQGTTPFSYAYTHRQCHVRIALLFLLQLHKFTNLRVLPRDKYASKKEHSMKPKLPIENVAETNITGIEEEQKHTRRHPGDV